MNLGTPEVIVCLLIALVVLGPDKLPTAARQLGRALAEVKKLTSDVQGQVQTFINAEDEKPQSPGGPQDPSKAKTVDLYEPPNPVTGMPGNTAELPVAPNPVKETFDAHPNTEGFRLINNEAPVIPAHVTPSPAAKSQLARHLEQSSAPKEETPTGTATPNSDSATPPSPWRAYDRDVEPGES